MRSFLQGGAFDPLGHLWHCALCTLTSHPLQESCLLILLQRFWCLMLCNSLDYVKEQGISLQYLGTETIIDQFV